MKASIKTGFTLIELLVVIAIIAILAAILFPVFARVREKARQTACLSNLKQLGLGYAQYEQDFDETPPNGVYKFGAGGSGWAGQMYAYVKSVKVYQCPDDLNKDKGTWISYAVNSNMGTGVFPYSAFPISKYTAPAKTVVLAEVTGSVAFPGYTAFDITLDQEGALAPSGGSPFGNGAPKGYSPNGGGGSPTCPAVANQSLQWATGYLGGYNPAVQYSGATQMSCHWTGPEGRHNGGSNFLMADNHAKWFRGSSVSPGGNGASETANQVWNPGNGGQAAGTAGTINGAPVGATFSVL